MGTPGTPPPGDARTKPRASLAAFLSFLFPGLGQAYNGQSGLAWLLAAPVLLLVAAAAVALLVATPELLARLFDIRFLVGLIVLDAALLAWRLVAVLQAHGARARPALRSRATLVTAILVTLTLAMHVLPGYYAAKAIDTIRSVALGGSHGGDIGDVIPVFSGLPEPS